MNERRTSLPVAAACSRAALLGCLALACQAPDPSVERGGWESPALTLGAGGYEASRPTSIAGTWTLPALIERAVSVSPSREVTAAAIDRASAALAAAQSAYGVNIDFGLNATYTDNPVYAFMGDLNAGELDLASGLSNTPWTAHSQAGLHAGTLLWDGGRRAASEASAAHGVESSRLAARARALGVEAAVAGLYLGLRESLAFESAAEVRLEAVERALEAARARLAAGSGLGSDVDSIVARREAVREALLVARSMRAEQLGSLAVLIGGKSGAQLEIDLDASAGGWSGEDWFLGTAEALDTGVLVGRAIRSRPDVAAAFAAVAAQDEGLAAAERASGPTISAFADAWLDGGTPFLATDRGSANIGAALNWNLADGGLRDAREAGARAELRAARARLAEIVERVELEVLRAQRAGRLARQRRASAGLAARSASSALAELAAGYEAGTVTLERWLGAEAAAGEAAARVVQTNAREALARAQMRLTLGISLIAPLPEVEAQP